MLSHDPRAIPCYSPSVDRVTAGGGHGAPAATWYLRERDRDPGRHQAEEREGAGPAALGLAPSGAGQERQERGRQLGALHPPQAPAGVRGPPSSSCRGRRPLAPLESLQGCCGGAAQRPAWLLRAAPGRQGWPEPAVCVEPCSEPGGGHICLVWATTSRPWPITRALQVTMLPRGSRLRARARGCGRRLAPRCGGQRRGAGGGTAPPCAATGRRGRQRARRAGPSRPRPVPVPVPGRGGGAQPAPGAAGAEAGGEPPSAAPWRSEPAPAPARPPRRRT